MRLLRLEDLEEKVGFKSSYIYQLIGKGVLPMPVKVGRASRWVEEEVDRALVRLSSTPRKLAEDVAGTLMKRMGPIRAGPSRRGPGSRGELSRPPSQAARKSAPKRRLSRG